MLPSGLGVIYPGGCPVSSDRYAAARANRMSGGGFAFVLFAGPSPMNLESWLAETSCFVLNTLEFMLDTYFLVASTK